MKNYFVITIILLSSVLFGQKKSIYVEYNVKINEEKDLFSNNADLKKLYSRAMSEAYKLSFVLLINESGSKFYNREILVTDDRANSRNSALIFSSYSGEVYQYENSIFTENTSFGQKTIVKESLQDNWIMHNESKMIDSYVCYKATNTKIIDNGSGKIFHHPIVAWYCPQLPYNYGPNGYSNLPGLILELQVRYTVFGVKKIDLNSAIEFDPTFLKNIKTVTLKEYNERIEEEVQSWKK